MEVHPPDHPILTPRDFFVHLFTITVGLLIALGLEGLAEYAHHKHIVHQARENIRQELAQNEQQSRQDAAYLTANLARVEGNITTIHALEANAKGPHSLQYRMEFSDLDDAAWRTARDTGALAFMPYDEVQRDSEIYNAQAVVQQKVEALADREFLALGPMLTGDDLSKLKADQYTTLLQTNGGIIIGVCTLREYVEQLNAQYQQALGLHDPPMRDGCSNL